MFDYASIGRNIVALRKRKGLTQEDLALESDMSISFLRQLEHGRVNVSLDSLDKLAATLGIPSWTLLVLHMDDQTILDTLHEVRQPEKEMAVV